MSDLSTFTKAKDWIIVTLVGLIFALLGMVAAENRRRIEAIEQRQDNHVTMINMHSERIGRLEETHREIGRRLERIEDKLDRLRNGHS